MEDKRDRVACWVDRATRGIRFGPDRRAVARELEDHLEDKTAELVRLYQLPLEEARAQAEGQMGDAEEIGRALARLHRPWLGFLWQGSRILLGLVCLALFCNLCYWGDDAFLGDDPYSELWDWDGLPKWSESRFVGGEEDGLLWTAQPGDRVELGTHRLELSRAALWQEEQGRVLYLYLKLTTPFFWERGALEQEWMRAEDSTGQTYPLDRRLLPPLPSEQPLPPDRLESGGFGPFHCGQVLKLYDVPEQAEWIRISYGEAGVEIFTMTVELGEGAEG